MTVTPNSTSRALLFGAALIALGVLAAWASPARARPHPEEACEREKVRQIGEYGRCRMEATQKARDTGTKANFEACDAAFAAHEGRDCSSDSSNDGITETSSSAPR